jgi:hypothetical protein
MSEISLNIFNQLALDDTRCYTAKRVQIPGTLEHAEPSQQEAEGRDLNFRVAGPAGEAPSA